MGDVELELERPELVLPRGVPHEVAEVDAQVPEVALLRERGRREPGVELVAAPEPPARRDRRRGPRPPGPWCRGGLVAAAGDVARERLSLGPCFSLFLVCAARDGSARREGVCSGRFPRKSLATVGPKPRPRVGGRWAWEVPRRLRGCVWVGRKRFRRGFRTYVARTAGTIRERREPIERADLVDGPGPRVSA